MASSLSYRDGLGTAEKLAKQDPANAGWQSDLAWVYWRTGSAWEKAEPKSKTEAAVTRWVRGLGSHTRLAGATVEV